MTNVLKILVADDLEPNLRLVTRHLERHGHDVVGVTDGQQAYDEFNKQVFDVVLLDVMMPGMNGHEVATKIRSDASYKWVPIIFLSALSKGDDIVKGLEAGGDDYLTKPIDLTLLDARIMAMQRIAAMQNELAEKTERLEHLNRRAEKENNMASEIMRRIIHVQDVDEDILKHWVLPADCFCGDMVSAVHANNDRLYILHADSTGHGLSAAIPLLPLSQTFYAMAEKGFSLPTIVSEINKCTRRYIPIERFVAAMLVCIDFRNRLVEVWNGGCPDALYVDDNGQVLQTFTSEHVAFGVVDENSFDSGTTVMQWQSPGQLVMFSDGLIEARDDQGRMFGEEGVLTALTGNTDQDMFNGLVDALTLHMGTDTAQDDISVMMARCQ